jgi:hypothetical protein
MHGNAALVIGRLRFENRDDLIQNVPSPRSFPYPQVDFDRCAVRRRRDGRSAIQR